MKEMTQVWYSNVHLASKLPSANIIIHIYE